MQKLIKKVVLILGNLLYVHENIQRFSILSELISTRLIFDFLIRRPISNKKQKTSENEVFSDVTFFT